VQISIKQLRSDGGRGIAQMSFSGNHFVVRTRSEIDSRDGHYDDVVGLRVIPDYSRCAAQKIGRGHRRQVYMVVVES
jgi:hypothetical protein